MLMQRETPVTVGSLLKAACLNYCSFPFNTESISIKYKVKIKKKNPTPAEKLFHPNST